MRKFWTFTVLGFIALLVCTTCAGVAKGKSDSEGILKIENKSGVELAIYVDQAYKKTAKPGDNLTIQVNDVKSVGKQVDIDFFTRAKLTDLSNFPTNRDARYCSFPTVVMPLSDPSPVTPIVIRNLSAEDLSNNVGINNVLVRFIYNDLPQFRSTVSVFTGSQDQPNEIVNLKNGDIRLVPMKPEYHLISMNYAVGTQKDGVLHYIYPKTPTQRNDRRFGVNVPEGVMETEHMIPSISDIYNVTYISKNPATSGTLRVKNQSSSQVRIRMGSGTVDEPIAANNAVTNDVPYRNFLISAGNYYLRAVNAANVYNEIARIENISIEPGMIYYWFIQDQGSSLRSGVNMSVPQQVNNWFQDWTIKTMQERTKISLRITSTAEGVQNTHRDIGVTNGSGDLVRQNIDIGDLIRGLSTENAKRVTLTLIAEKDDYYPSSQSISAYNLLEAGKEFRPDVFSLEKIDIKNTEIRIEDPKIP